MHVYLGAFLLAAATLALEITLTRLLSVATWYHLAFFAIGVAMLGMTAGASTVYLKPRQFDPDRVDGGAAKACLGFALSIPASLIALCLVPVDLTRSAMSLIALALATVACAAPFYFSGIAITAILTKYPLPIGKLYASDLAGASLGCLVVLGGLEAVDAPSLILFCGAGGALAGLCFASRSRIPRLEQRMMTCGAVLVFLAIANSYVQCGIQPYVVKGKIQPSGNFQMVKWNSFSRVAAFHESTLEPLFWGPSPLAPAYVPIPRVRLEIDGEASSVLQRFQSPRDLDVLRFDVTNVAQRLRPKGPVCVIGVGGGRDILSAILFGHERILGVEVNPIFVDLLRNRFRDFSRIVDHPGVTLVVDEARSYLSRSREEFSQIQMSLTDTWAATGAGAFTLSENALYTIEAWKTFLSRLSGDGIFTVSRWYSPDRIGEAGRLVSLAVAALLESGASNPDRHIALITVGNIATLVLGHQPLSQKDVAELNRTCSELQFQAAILPGVPPSNEALRRIVSAKSLAQLRQFTAGEPLNYDPPTDDNPYFFNMLRLNRLAPASWAVPGVVHGNAVATFTLLALVACLLAACGGAIVLPLARAAGTPGEGANSVFWPAAVYFSLIGAGFMFAEVALVQRLSVFLGHPIYALGVLLFAIIASAGAGSWLSERLPLVRRPWIFVYPVAIAAAILAVRFVLPILGANLMPASRMVRIAASVAVIGPLGVLMGLCFPTGMRLVRSAKAAETPWYFALNGIFGVLSSALTVFVSIYLGIAMSLYVASACYVLLLLCLPAMRKASSETPV